MEIVDVITKSDLLKIDSSFAFFKWFLYCIKQGFSKGYGLAHSSSSL
jgi:hypothetical protein